MIELLIPLKQHCEQSGITLNQLALLVCLEGPPTTLSTLAGQLAVSTAAITGQIDALTAKGYLTAVPDLKDRRVKRPQTTSKGRELLTAAHQLCAAA